MPSNYRYSLRGIFVLVAIFGVFCAIYHFLALPRQNETRALAKLGAVGKQSISRRQTSTKYNGNDYIEPTDYVAFVETIPPLRSWRCGPIAEPRVTQLHIVGTANVQQFVKLNFCFPSLSELKVDCDSCPSELFSELRKNRRLSKLEIKCSETLPVGLEALASISTLEELAISVQYLRGADVGAIGRCSHLTVLSLKYGELTMSKGDVERLQGLKELRGLFISGECDNEWCSLLADLPNLDVVSIDSEHITDEGIALLCQSESISTVVLTCEELSSACIAHFATMESLRSLTLVNTNISDRELDRLRTERPDIDISR